MRGARVGDLLRGEARVRGAVAGPEDVLHAELVRDVRAEVLVGHEQDLAVLREPRHDLFGVAGGDADVALGLHLGGGVHVADGGGAGVLRLELAELRARDHVRHRAAGRGVGDEHGLARVEDGGRLGHEVDAAEHDHVRLHRGGLARELERVAREVCDVLHLVALVVVGEDDGVAGLFQLRDLFG